MTSENMGITIEDASATFKSFAWQNFGYPTEMINGSRVNDKLSVVSCPYIIITLLLIISDHGQTERS